MLTIENIIASVRQLVQENPETKYINSVCLYTEGEASNGKCGCLIGQAILNVCPELKEKLAQFDNGIDMVSAGGLMKEFGVESLIEQRDWLNAVQNHQDLGWVWKDAVNEADERFPGV